MVSKRLKGHYFKSYGQFSKKTDIKWRVSTKIGYTSVFLNRKNKKKWSKNGILASESSKKEELQKWFQNGSKAIILRVMGNFRKKKNRF